MADKETQARLQGMLRHIGDLLLTDAQLFGVEHIDVFCIRDSEHTYVCASVFDEGWEDAGYSRMWELTDMGEAEDEQG